jgi:hypothetical protein
MPAGFAYDLETQTRSNHGDFMRNRQGELKMADGYRVLIMIEDYSGEDVTSEDGAPALF